MFWLDCSTPKSDMYFWLCFSRRSQLRETGGFYCSWQSASQQVAVAFTALLGFGLVLWVPEATMSAWGWRIPLAIGCLIIPIILWLRQSLEETAEFQRMRHHPRRVSEVLQMLWANRQIVLVGMMIVVTTTTLFYLITAYAGKFRCFLERRI